MNIFDKLNDTMNATQNTINNLEIINLKRIEKEFGDLHITVTFTTNNHIAVRIYNIDNDVISHNKCYFDNDKQDNDHNLTPRYFYKECRDNINNFSEKQDQLLNILNYVNDTLINEMSKMYQSEKQFLIPFLK